MRRLIFIFLFMFSSPLAAWDFGETESFACFQEFSKKPVKVTVDNSGNININWDKYSTKYDFMGRDGDKLLTGSVWQVLQKGMTRNRDKFFQGGNLDKNWLQTALVMFDFETKKLSYNEVERPNSIRKNVYALLELGVSEGMIKCSDKAKKKYTIMPKGGWSPEMSDTPLQLLHPLQFPA